MRKQSGFSLLSMLLTVVIIALAYYFIAKSNFSTASLLDKDTKKVLKNQGINTDGYSEMIDSAKKQADKLNNKIKEQEKQLQQFE